MAVSAKDCLVDVLKSLGACNTQTKAELARAEIAEHLQLNDSGQIRDSIKLGVLRQLALDRRDQDLQSRELAYDFNAAKQILLDNGVFKGIKTKHSQGRVLDESALCDTLFSKLRVDADNVTDILLAGVITGLPEREGLANKEAEQVTAVLADTVLVGYREFLQAHPNLTADTFSPADYKEIQNQLKIAKHLTALLGDQQQAMQILNQPLTADSPALHNVALSGDYQAISQQRQARGDNGTLSGVANDGQVRVLDLFMAMSNSVTKAQVIAFCEERATQQDVVNDQRLPLNDPARLVNTLGHAGRKTIETTIDGHISDKLIPATKAPVGAPLPDTAFRGRSKLATLITQTVKSLFSSVQSGLLFERMLASKNIAKAQADQNLWHIAAFAVTPEQYRDDQGRLNAAGEFFERVQARMVADRVKVTAYQMRVQTNPRDAEAATKLQYYENRLYAADEILKKVAAETKKYPSLVQDQAYFQDLDAKILALNDNSPATIDLLQEQAVVDVVAQDSNNTKEAYWVDALQTFKDHNNQAQGTAANTASYQMLADLLGLGDRYGRDINVDDLTNLVQNMANGPFNPKKVDQLIKGLKAKPNSKNALTAADCRLGLHDAAVQFLAKVKYKDVRANYDLTVGAEKQLENM